MSQHTLRISGLDPALSAFCRRLRKASNVLCPITFAWRVGNIAQFVFIADEYREIWEEEAIAAGLSIIGHTVEAT
jgi:hypothetical protein